MTCDTREHGRTRERFADQSISVFSPVLLFLLANSKARRGTFDLRGRGSMEIHKCEMQSSAPCHFAPLRPSPLSRCFTFSLSRSYFLSPLSDCSPPSPFRSHFLRLAVFPLHHSVSLSLISHFRRLAETSTFDRGKRHTRVSGRSRRNTAASGARKFRACLSRVGVSRSARTVILV